MWYKNLGGTFVRFVTIHAVTDGRTDRQTDTFAIGRTTLHTMQRGKNGLYKPNTNHTSHALSDNDMVSVSILTAATHVYDKLCILYEVVHVHQMLHAGIQRAMLK